MDTKGIKGIKNAGIGALVSLALVASVSIGSWSSVGAQTSRTGPATTTTTPQGSGQAASTTSSLDRYTGTISAISGSSLTLSTADKKETRQVRTDPATVVFKNGGFVSLADLKLGDKVVVDPPMELPSIADNAGSNGRPGAGATANGNGVPGAAAASPAQPNTPVNGQEKKDLRPTTPATSGGGNGSSSGSTNGAPTGAASSPPAAPANPSTGTGPKDLKSQTQNPRASAQGNSTGGSNGSNAATPAQPAAARVIWVQSNGERLIGGVVGGMQGNTVILYIPGSAYSDYAVQLTNATTYKSVQSLTGAPVTSTLAGVQKNTSVMALGVDSADGKAGVFNAKAVVIYSATPAAPATGLPGQESQP